MYKAWCISSSFDGDYHALRWAAMRKRETSIWLDTRYTPITKGVEFSVGTEEDEYYGSMPVMGSGSLYLNALEDYDKVIPLLNKIETDTTLLYGRG